jgi:hypothetical protein
LNTSPPPLALRAQKKPFIDLKKLNQLQKSVIFPFIMKFKASERFVKGKVALRSAVLVSLGLPLKLARKRECPCLGYVEVGANVLCEKLPLGCQTPEVSDFSLTRRIDSGESS